MVDKYVIKLQIILNNSVIINIKNYVIKNNYLIIMRINSIIFFKNTIITYYKYDYLENIAVSIRLFDLT